MPPAVRGRGQEADVARQRPDIPRVVRQPFQLQRHAAQRLRPQRRLGPGQRLDCLAVCGRVAHRAITGHLLHQVDRALVRPAHQGPLHPAMLIAQGDLQVKDVLAVTLEAEVPGLDDAGVDGPDRDLVDLMALDAEEIGSGRRDGGLDDLGSRPRPGVVSRAIGPVEPDRLEPGVPARDQPPLLGDLPLEPVGLGAVGRQGRVAVSARRL